MSLRHRVVRLERKFPAPPPPSPEDLQATKRWKQICRRLPQTVDRAVPLMSEEQVEQVNQGMSLLVEDLEGPYSRWLQDLLDGRCRMPELSAEAGKELLLAWLSPEVEGAYVCMQCGLEYPKHRSPPLSEWKVLPGKTPLVGEPPWYDLPEFFHACPNCGASCFDIDWPHLIPDKHYAWMELDGYMGLGWKPRKLPA